MYDNNGRYPLWLDILQYAERMALATRVVDINMAHQKTPRFWKTKTNMKKSIEDMINNVDGDENVVLTYDNVDLNDTTLIFFTSSPSSSAIAAHAAAIISPLLAISAFLPA